MFLLSAHTCTFLSATKHTLTQFESSIQRVLHTPPQAGVNIFFFLAIGILTHIMHNFAVTQIYFYFLLSISYVYSYLSTQYCQRLITATKAFSPKEGQKLGMLLLVYLEIGHLLLMYPIYFLSPSPSHMGIQVQKRHLNCNIPCC